MDRQLTAAELRELFAELAAELRSRNVIGQVHLAGGAAMALAYGSELTTGDADAVFEPDGPMIAAIHAVARRRALPQSWLNNQASSYFSTRARPTEVVYDDPHLRVLATPAEHLLAMKVLAARSTRDRDDAERLLEHLGWSRKAQVVEAFTHYFPDEDLTGHPRRRAFLEALGLTE